MQQRRWWLLDCLILRFCCHLSSKGYLNARLRFWILHGHNVFPWLYCRASFLLIFVVELLTDLFVFVFSLTGCCRYVWGLGCFISVDLGCWRWLWFDIGGLRSSLKVLLHDVASLGLAY